ncbi:hypothetical protein [Pelagibacterium xiamenense]|uniref:hypothetical protein n=1 Tax=Pelagibacterium xiamenense TaxID=2901140 RepID=UPI001E59DBC1|nr:hypothetical protein [Pelagibacterium xiamenense]MCD7058667.1 hypothetical protein [Pelagibacterium xiamenense]
MASERKTSRQLEREIDARRMRIEQKADQLSTRLSPGHLIDEALRFTKDGPLAGYADNVKRNVIANPLPVLLVGAGLAWLVSRPASGNDEVPTDRRVTQSSGYDDEECEYPVAVIKGTWLQRVEVVDAEDGKRHSAFTDQAGRKFKALTDEIGNRAGHFTDEAGHIFQGFIDEAGHRITDFRDEAGQRISRARGWASHNWRQFEEGAGQLGDRLQTASSQLGAQATRAGDAVADQAKHAGGIVDDFVHDQPLVSGAIAFAVGALLGGSLPQTRQEDKSLGEASDSVRRAFDDAAEGLEGLYERGREAAGELHDRARDTADRVHEKLRDTASDAQDAADTEDEKAADR